MENITQEINIYLEEKCDGLNNIGPENLESISLNQ